MLKRRSLEKEIQILKKLNCTCTYNVHIDFSLLLSALIIILLSIVLYFPLTSDCRRNLLESLINNLII